MKIKVANRKYLNRGTLNLIWALEQNPKFEKRILKIRHKLELTSKNGKREINPVRLKRNKVFFEKAELGRYEFLKNEVKKLLRDFKLPQGWLKTIEAFILTNKLSLYPQEEISLEISKNGSYAIGPNVTSGGVDGVKIVISGKVARNKLQTWIEEHWGEIEKFMDFTELKEKELIKWTRLGVVKRIVKLRDVKRKSFGEITDKLGMNDENYVKTLYHRYKKRLKKTLL